MGKRVTVRVTMDLSPEQAEEAKRRLRERWKREHDTPFPGLKEWMRMLVREEYREEQARD